MAKRGPKELSSEHKAAMAAGRTEGRAVKKYLEALEQNKPKRGRKRSPESIATRLEKIDDTISMAEPVARLTLVQERMDLEKELAAMEDPVDLESLEDEFVEAAPGYSERKGITYAAWREVGVPAAVLKRAGITRGG